jgi:3-methyl-2-oxobutanoate hydroxymethyltransferase
MTARTTLSSLIEKYREGEKLALLTCYDASFAAMLIRAGVDALLVGDSSGMVIAGHGSTLPVSMEDMLYHTRAVSRGAPEAFIIADIPFGSFQVSPGETLKNAAKLMAAGANMVKLEGGAWAADTVSCLVDRGIPVCGHLGLLPQSVNLTGGYRVQGKERADAERMLDDARSLQQAGAQMLVLEAIPSALAEKITQALTVPTIGIGAGPETSGQVLVLYDMLGIFPGPKPRFVKNFMAGSPSIEAAVTTYVHAVKKRAFPEDGHAY